MSLLLHLELQWSSSDACAVDLPRVYCTVCTLLYTSTSRTPPPTTARQCLNRSPGSTPLPISRHVASLYMMFSLFLVYVSRLGLCLFSRLICDLLQRQVRCCLLFSLKFKSGSLNQEGTPEESQNAR